MIYVGNFKKTHLNLYDIRINNGKKKLSAHTRVNKFLKLEF